MRATTLVSLLLLLAFAGDTEAQQKPPSFSAYAGQNVPLNVYWGDTHIHTQLSLDAGTSGSAGVEFGAELAYRFAMGEEVEIGLAGHAQIHRPLDFLVVADHAEYLGVVPQVRAGNPDLLATEGGRRWYELTRSKDGTGAALMIGAAAFRGEHILDPELVAPIVRQTWKRQVKLADAYNQPGIFTALIGFEYSAAPGVNQHRNVIFRDGADRAARVLPFSALDSLRPEDLWAYMEAYERETGGRVLAIPHNSNLSNGMMWSLKDSDGNPIDTEYAKTRVRWEPIVEVTQTKGDSETHPFLSPEDEFADFERWDWGSAAGPKEDWMFKHEYARSALGIGLSLEAQTGINPYKFGMIGSTDEHTALPVAEEDNFWGVSARLRPGDPERMTSVFFRWKDLTTHQADIGASGYAAVWATENTRESLFDAMQRREVYATTGSRMVVRFFGGWHYQHTDAQRPHLALVGYDGGVPMGSDLPPRPKRDSAPTFLVAALKDPEGANLDRIQIVKGWVDGTGQSREQIYDVALSDERSAGPDGQAPPVGSTVDVKNAAYTNSIGEAELATVWRDPDFTPSQRAFYYVRVIEIPTPRWTAYEAKRFASPVPEGTPMTLQERAYTSPIWYTPAP